MSAEMHPVTAGQHDDQIVAMRRSGASNKTICAALDCTREPLERRVRMLIEQGRICARRVKIMHVAPRAWDIEAALHLHHAEFSDWQIAWYFGVLTATASDRITSALVYGSGLPAPVLTARDCRMCRRSFDSDGARVCDGCKETQVWRSGGSASLSGVRITEHG